MKLKIILFLVAIGLMGTIYFATKSKEEGLIYGVYAVTVILIFVLINQ